MMYKWKNRQRMHFKTNKENCLFHYFFTKASDWSVYLSILFLRYFRCARINRFFIFLKFIENARVKKKKSFGERSHITSKILLRGVEGGLKSRFLTLRNIQTLPFGKILQLLVFLRVELLKCKAFRIN